MLLVMVVVLGPGVMDQLRLSTLSAFGCRARRDPVVNGSTIVCVKEIVIRVLLPFSVLTYTSSSLMPEHVLVFQHILFLLSPSGSNIYSRLSSTSDQGVGSSVIDKVILRN
jgi:hypothetical protein